MRAIRPQERNRLEHTQADICMYYNTLMYKHTSVKSTLRTFKAVVFPSLVTGSVLRGGVLMRSR